MKRIWKYLFVIMTGLMNNVSVTVGQNLVPNQSFEIYDTCPTAQDQIQRSTGWSKYSAAITTPDYFNACAPPGYFSVPNGGTGCYQYARTGNAFAAIVGYAPNIPTYREHIGIKLTQQLVIGQKYFISFYTCMGELNGLGAFSNKIGIRLSTIAYNGSAPVPIDNFAHVYSNTIISDTVNWINISGSIVADSAYNYLIVGNFFDNANTDTIKYSSTSYYGYFLIEDICLSKDSLQCNTGDNNINDILSDDEIIVFPNPVTDYLNISLQNGNNAEILIYDKIGKMVYSNTIKNKNPFTIDLTSFSSGFYLLKVITQNAKGTIIKQIIKF